MKILITGATGLVGNRVAQELHARGHEVVELRRYVSSRQWKPVPWKVAPYDLRGGGTLPDETYDIVLHLAAMASNSVANVNPVEAFDIIATGTQRLIQEAHRVSAPWFILASSSEVYARPGEREALNPYAAAKIAAEEAVKASCPMYTIMRPFNTYGRANVGMPVSVVDKWVIAAITGQPIYVGDNMEVKRDFLWREDHVSGYLHLIDAGLSGNATYEMGTGMAISLQTLLGELHKRFRLNTQPGFSRPGDVPVLQANPKNFIPGWSPKVPFTEGLDLCISEWEARLGSRDRQPAAQTA